MRSTLAVVIAFVAMAAGVLIVSVAPWFALGVDRVLEPGRFESKPAVDVYAVVVGVAGAALAGWICGKIAHSRVAVIVLAGVCFAAGMGNALGQLRKPAPGPRTPGVSVVQAISARKEPAWFVLLMPCLGAASVLVTGFKATATDMK
jgi:hypothetical protein